MPGNAPPATTTAAGLRCRSASTTSCSPSHRPTRVHVGGHSRSNDRQMDLTKASRDLSRHLLMRPIGTGPRFAT
jgi:hypothetical protein